MPWLESVKLFPAAKLLNSGVFMMGMSINYRPLSSGGDDDPVARGRSRLLRRVGDISRGQLFKCFFDGWKIYKPNL